MSELPPTGPFPRRQLPSEVQLAILHILVFEPGDRSARWPHINYMLVCRSWNVAYRAELIRNAPLSYLFKDCPNSSVLHDALDFRIACSPGRLKLDNGRSIASDAVIRGLYPALQRLIDETEIDINEVNNFGVSLLDDAVYLEQLPCVKLLCARGAEVDYDGGWPDWRETPLTMAIDLDYVDIAAELVHHGADLATTKFIWESYLAPGPGMRLFFGYEPYEDNAGKPDRRIHVNLLVYSVWSQKIEITRLLLAAGILALVSDEGWPLLYWASKKEGMTELLLAMGYKAHSTA